MRTSKLFKGLALTMALGAAAATENPPPPTPLLQPGNTVPPVKDRAAAELATPRLLVDGIRVKGVGEHAEVGVTPQSIQALADAEYQKAAASAGQPVRLSVAQLLSIAELITASYKKAGFIVARAFLPAQTVGDDKIVEITVLEGNIGKIMVKGNKRYRADVIAAPAAKLEGQPLLKRRVDSALLYARDLPGVTVAATFEPGEKTGDTNLVLIANEAARPYTVTVGANNFGTDFTGRYRAQLGFTLNSPLGIGDQLTGKLEYAIDPTNNVYGAVTYRTPTVAVPGLTLVGSFARNELQINTGSFAALNIKGPTSVAQGGLEWKFVNTLDLQSVASLLYINEHSRLSSQGVQLADQEFGVAALKVGVNRTDRRFNGVDLLELGLRQSVVDRSTTPDLVSPGHASNFLVGTLAYTRLQFLTKGQRLFGKLSGQYTDKALIPLEQFVLGGPDSVRAYPIAEALRDRGYFAALEYHIDAPGFGDKISPFYGRPWRELLEFEVFADYAKGFAAGDNRLFGQGAIDTELSGVGAGVIFRVPGFHQLQFHLQGAVPLSAQPSSDGDDYHIYGQVSLTF